MCGIGGILRTDGQPIPEEWLDAIDARIAYRGPDGHGRFRDRVEIDDPSVPGGKRVVEVAFVHRRLSIIDHKDGAQPMVSQRGRNDSEGLVAVVFNGCIYNHRELRKELEGKGHKFVTDHSDTEVLIHGWREWGEDLVDHLEGMYAFGLWDRNAGSLLLARDRFGEKPLFVQSDTQVFGWCAFGSDAAAVNGIAHRSAVHFQLAPLQWLQGYLQLGYGPEGSTPFGKGVQLSSVDPGGALHLTPLTVRGRGRPNYLCEDEGVSEDQLIELLRKSVHCRLEADVPLGCFLSGGIDSSLIAHFARERTGQLHTFTVKMPDSRYDESQFGQRVAQHLGTIHSTLNVELNPAQDLGHLINILGLPFGDSSILPTFWVSKAARAHVKVALAGDGGDELFLGYERYIAARFLAKSWNVLSRFSSRFFRRFHAKSRASKFGRLIDMSKDYPFTGMAAMESIFALDQIAALTNDPTWESAGANPCIDPRCAIEELREFDVGSYLPNDLLTKVDTASMACGLEVRCPFLDRDLARAALSAPIEQLMPRGQRKGLLRHIARKYLPKEIVDRPKMGFAIPIGEWFRDDDLPHKGSGMKTLLLDHLNSTEPFGPIQLNRKAVQRFIDEHMSCKRDHGQRLFTLLTLSIWARSLKETRKSTNT